RPQHGRLRGRRVQCAVEPRGRGRDDGPWLRGGPLDPGLLPPADARGGAMNQNTSFYRKIAYGVALVVLAPLLALLGAPATRDEAGGKLAVMRRDHRLGQADLGAIDPASETIRLATLGLRGVAVSMLWTKANEAKKTEDWTTFQSTLEQLARLQPYFIKV